MLLSILGRYGPYPPYGGACSGFLLQAGGHNIVVDMGSGTLSRLQKFISPEKISAIIISHFHNDHLTDLYILRYALEGKMENRSPLPVYIPEACREELERISYKNVFCPVIMQPKEPPSFPYCQVEILKTKHPVLCYALKLVNNGKTFVYSGDTALFPELANFALEADLFLCEANFLHSQLTKESKNHLSALQAAELAAQSEVKHLLLTHLHPHQNAGLYQEEAASVFPCAELAEEERTYFI